jgi:hypothetical protein
MAPRVAKSNGDDSATSDKIGYIREMLVQLRRIAEEEHADMLSYLLEMACVEAGDLSAARQANSTLHGKRH